MNGFLAVITATASPWIWTFRVANLIAGIMLLIIPAVLGYFMKKKDRGISDRVIAVAIAATSLLGVKLLLIVAYQGRAGLPASCAIVDVCCAVALLVLAWLLPPLVLKILAIVSRERLLHDLIAETQDKIVAQDSVTSLEIKNAELRALIFQFESAMEIYHRSKQWTDVVAQLKKAIATPGGENHGD